MTGFALILDKDGEPIQPGGAPTFGASVGDDRVSSGDFVYRQGRQPTGADQVAIDARTAEQAGFQLGDKVDVVLQDGRQTFTLVGIIGFGETDSLLGATMAGLRPHHRPAGPRQGRRGRRGRRAGRARRERR